MRPYDDGAIYHELLRLHAVVAEDGDIGRPFQRVVHRADETVALASACECQDTVAYANADHVDDLGHVHLLNAHR